MTHNELLDIVGDVPNRFSPRWKADKDETVGGDVRLCSCKLNGNFGYDGPSAKWHRSGTASTHPHPTRAGISAEMAEMLWVASMFRGLLAIGKLPPLTADDPLVATLAVACIAAGPGDASQQTVHDDDPLVRHAPKSIHVVGYERV